MNDFNNEELNSWRNVIMNEVNEPTQDEIFEYLEELRESGVTNMLGAGPYLQSEFGFSKQDAHSWLFKWIESYNKDG